jgi:hypothetical protein
MTKRPPRPMCYSRHDPDYRGICRRCHTEVAEPWYMRRRPEPEELVTQIATRWRVTMNPTAAREIAQALLGWADAALEVSEIVVKHIWAETRFEARIRQDLRTKLFDEVTKQGRIPTALPSWALRYLDVPQSFGSEGAEIPPDAVAAGAPYEFVQVILAMPVRTPPVDRAAAVKAGLL